MFCGREPGNIHIVIMREKSVYQGLVSVVKHKSQVQQDEPEYGNSGNG